MTSSDRAWPNSADQLIQAPSGGTPWGWADIGWQRNGPENVHHAQGFRLAVEFLSKEIEGSTRVDLSDLMFYPLAFCYRHLIELDLKMLRKTLQEAVNGKSNSKFKHTLESLWSDCELLLCEVPGVNEDNNEDVRRILHDFDLLDPSADSFRYSEPRQEGLFVGIDRIDTKNFCRVLEGVDHFLLGARDLVEAWREESRDIP